MVDGADVQQLRSLLQGVFRHSPVAIYMTDRDQRWVYANPETYRGLHIEPDTSLTGRPVRDTVPASLAEGFAASDRVVLDEQEAGSFVQEITDPRTGETRTFMSVKFPIRGADGGLAGVGGVSFDISKRERVRRELSYATSMLSAVFSAARLGIVVLLLSEDPLSSEIIECNDAFEAMAGRSHEDLIGRSGATLIHDDDQDERNRLLSELMSGRTPVAELRLVRPDGDSIWCMVVPALTEGPDGERLLVVEVLDVSERREFEHRLRYHAEHDPLTDLLSRRSFFETLRQQIDEVHVTGGVATVLILDLDGFKHVNDFLGHTVGDVLLRRIGAALADSVRESDHLARIGGDEFAVLLPDTTLGEALPVAEKMIAMVVEHGCVETDAGRVRVTASVGVTSWDGSVRVDADQVLTEADVAMYDAKDQGKNRIGVYGRDDTRRLRLGRRSDRLGRIREAISSGSFVLHAQPVASLLSPKPEVSHYELLVRMQLPDRGLVMPGDFLPDAERHGLISAIDDWVLTEAVRILKLRRAAGRPVDLAVNLSARTIEDPTLGDRIEQLLISEGVPAQMLMVELTETGEICDLGRVRELVRQLREVGCRFALDDFGAAFATLQYLKHVDFDLVKIDGDFIRSLPTSSADQLIVKSVAEIARGFGAGVVAEYVEDAETIELLRSFGIQYGQGLELGPPVPLSV